MFGLVRLRLQARSSPAMWTPTVLDQVQAGAPRRHGAPTSPPEKGSGLMKKIVIWIYCHRFVSIADAMSDEVNKNSNKSVLL